VGLEGDRYATGDGKYTRPTDGGERAVTLIEREAVDAARREYDIELQEHEPRRNIVTEGVALNHLVGRTFRVGDVVLRGFKLAEPCTYMEGLTRSGVRRALVHRAGLRAEILEGGVVHVGDSIEQVDA
jgi:MOSC domain-containing protein YiiM